MRSNRKYVRLGDMVPGAARFVKVSLKRCIFTHLFAPTATQMRVCEVASRKRENSSRTTKHDVQADSRLAKSSGAKLSTACPNVLAPTDVPAHELEPVYRPMRRSLIARCPVPGHIPDEDVAGEDHVSLFRRVFQPIHEIELTGPKCATVKLAGTHGE